jgi:hypothetical protein
MRLTVLVTMLVVAAGVPARLSAQTPSGGPPPSFGTEYTAGTALQDFEMRRYRDWQLTINVTVPTSELQAVLPVGYQVLNPAAASSNVSIALVFQERAEILAAPVGVALGSYGPVDEVLVVAAARSAMGIVESLILDNLRSTQDAVNLTNTIFGPASARLPDVLRVKLTAEPGGEMLRFSARVGSGRLHIAAAAVFSPSGMTSSRNRPSPAPFRYVDSSIQPAIANRSLRAGTSVDQVTVPAADITFKQDRIRLPHGTLAVLTIVSGRIDRWQEFVQKLQ